MQDVLKIGTVLGISNWLGGGGREGYKTGQRDLKSGRAEITNRGSGYKSVQHRHLKATVFAIVVALLKEQEKP